MRLPYSFLYDNHIKGFIKINGDGVIQWSTAFGDDYNWEEPYSMIQTTDGCFVVAGMTETSTGQHDCLLVYLDNGGNILWHRTYGGSLMD